MRPTFKNGSTRARALAWAGWFGFATIAFYFALMNGEIAWRSSVNLLVMLVLGGWLILVRRQPLKIPVLNYHSVSSCPEWLHIAEQVSITPGAFERQLRYMKRQGYQTLFISEVRDALAGKIKLSSRGKYVAITFDDGYADNWIAAYPQLKRFGMKATLFVCTRFITEAANCRPIVEDAAEAERRNIDWSGYLTWPELEAMAKSGSIEIQSHGATHARVFVENKLKGFVGPGKPNLWLFWNARPEKRLSWWQELDQDRLLWGSPVFRQAPALANRAYRPDPRTVAHFCAWARKGEGALFQRADWEQCLRAEWRRTLDKQGDRGDWEDVETYERRVERELIESRVVLERRLGSKVEVLCWPENAFSKAGETIARRAGYTATVSNNHHSRNSVGEVSGTIVRTFIGSHAAGFKAPGLDQLAFVLELKVFEGWYIVYPLLAVMHHAKKVMFAFRRRIICRRDYVSIWG